MVKSLIKILARFLGYSKETRGNPEVTTGWTRRITLQKKKTLGKTSHNSSHVYGVPFVQKVGAQKKLVWHLAWKKIVCWTSAKKILGRPTPAKKFLDLA
jgi:hypothetical protein